MVRVSDVCINCCRSSRDKTNTADSLTLLPGVGGGSVGSTKRVGSVLNASEGGIVPPPPRTSKGGDEQQLGQSVVTKTVQRVSFRCTTGRMFFEVLNHYIDRVPHFHINIFFHVVHCSHYILKRFYFLPPTVTTTHEVGVHDEITLVE